jgi:hypothetical protein
LAVQKSRRAAGSFPGISGKGTQLIVEASIHSICSIFGTEDKPSVTEGRPRAASAIERHL